MRIKSKMQGVCSSDCLSPQKQNRFSFSSKLGSSSIESSSSFEKIKICCLFTG